MATSSASDRQQRYRSSTWGSLQTLTRALRESLRLRKIRKQKRMRNEANNEQMRRRSKSVGNAYIDDEISDIGISVAVASDIGPMVNQAKIRQLTMAQKMPRRRQSKSVDEVELADIKKSIDEERAKSTLSPNSNASNGQQTRRRSKDDHDLPSKTSKVKDSHYYVSEQKGFRKRFGRLFGSLRGRHHSPLQPETPSPSPTSEGEAADDITLDVNTSGEQNKSRNEEPNNQNNNEVNSEKTTTAEDRE